MPVSQLGAAQVTAALATLGFGMMVVVLRKGAQLHRAIGLAPSPSLPRLRAAVFTDRQRVPAPLMGAGQGGGDAAEGLRGSQ
jgi:hypothetical protein